MGFRRTNGLGIAHLLPGKDGDVGLTAKDNKLFVDAVLYRYRAGIPWRDLPERFGDPINIHKRFSRWAKAGVWERVFAFWAADADNEYAMIDSTIVRAHQGSVSSFVLGLLHLGITQQLLRHSDDLGLMV